MKNQPPITDPVAFVEAALKHLPADPADVTLEDLGLLAAAGNGLRAWVEANNAELAQLAARLMALPPRRRAALRLEACWLDGLSRRAEQAIRELTEYAAPALAAHGIHLITTTPEEAHAA